MSRYELWQATRDLVQGRRRDTDGDVHGWLAGEWHHRSNDQPRECLNGAIALAESQVYYGRKPEDYRLVQTQDGEELKQVLAQTILEQYPGSGYNRTSGPSDIIAWFNDGIVAGEEEKEEGRGQDAMNAILDKVENKLFERWWLDHDATWPDLVAEDEHLDQLLPLV